MKTSRSSVHFSVAGAAALAVLAGGLAAAPASAQTFYSATYFDGQFLSTDAATGTSSQIGTFGAGVKPDGLASYAGSLYTFDTTTDSLLKLDTSSGGTLTSYNVGVTGPVSVGGLAISSSGLAFLDVFQANSPLTAPLGTLYSFNLMDGLAATKVGTTPDLSALAFNADDTLYGLGKGDGDLYTVNTASGRGSLIGSLDPVNSSIGNDPVAALTFSGDTLYAAADSNLYTVSTATGAATLVGPFTDSNGFPFSSISGLAVAAVPESSSVVSFGILLGLGLLPLAVAAFRRKRAAA